MTTLTSSAIATLLEQAKQAFYQMASLSTKQKNEALLAFADLLAAHQSDLLAANAVDLEANKDSLAPALYQRLKLDEGKLTQLIQGIRDVAKLADPVGQILQVTKLDEDLILEKKSVPLGLIGIIFESRPDVLPQICSLILKSGNAVVFKAGREAVNTNAALMTVIAKLNGACPFLPQHWATLLDSREAVHEMLNYPQFVDLVIPRGSNELVQSIMAATRIPVLGHADGVCHLYVHPSASVTEAIDVIVDSKIQYPSACNALETLLVDAAIAAELLPALEEASQREGMTLMADEACRSFLPSAQVASEADWRTEYGNLTLAVKQVASVDEAIDHINTYGSHHTDGILGKDVDAQQTFVSRVDSASVFVNASTRFADGFRYGFGAEIGISTARTHARGPVGLEGLVSYKFQLTGKNQVVKDYVGAQPKATFKHELL